MTRLRAWPMPVARAAPSMPIAGKGPHPKISTGSRMMLATQPDIMQTMVTSIRPVAWKIFSRDMEAAITTENRKAMREYRTPISTMASSAVNIRRKGGITAMQAMVSTTPCKAFQKMLWAAAASALRASCAPRW